MLLALVVPARRFVGAAGTVVVAVVGDGVAVGAGVGVGVGVAFVPLLAAVYVESLYCQAPLIFDQRRTYTVLPFVGRPLTVRERLVPWLAP